MDRAAISERVEKQLHVYYGGKRCVITTSSDHVDWHHLNDRANESAFQNLIPLGRDFNLSLRDAPRHSGYGIKPQLDPETLQLTARRHFSADWNAGLAYGCARLAVFVARQYFGWSGSRLVRPITQALYYARTRLNHHLIDDILKRDLEPLTLAVTLSLEARFAILTEFASLLADHGNAHDAVELYIEADRVKPFHLLANPADAAAFFRRRAMTRGAAESSWLKAEADFKEALSIGEHSENLEVSVANSRAWALIDRGQSREAYDVLLPLYHRYRSAAFTVTNDLQPVNVTGWNIAELMHSFSVTAAVASRARVSSRDAFQKAMAAYQHLGAMPYMIRSGFWRLLEPTRHDLQMEASLSLPNRPKLPRKIVKRVQKIAQHVTQRR